MNEDVDVFVRREMLKLDIERIDMALEMMNETLKNKADDYPESIDYKFSQVIKLLIELENYHEQALQNEVEV